MILLHPDYLLFRVSDGETIPCSAEVATVELLGDSLAVCDPELVRDAASAVLHYFRHELGRDCVSVAEFAEALVRVLRGFGLKVAIADSSTPNSISPAASSADSPKPSISVSAAGTASGPGLEADASAPTATVPAKRFVMELDLRQLACTCDKGFELAFFPRLRDELRTNLGQSPEIIRFKGLRGCVKLLLGARRWSSRCQELNDRIVNYLCGCLEEEPAAKGCSIVVQ